MSLDERISVLPAVAVGWGHPSTLETSRMRVRPCVCGRSVRADRWMPADGVAHHNRTREHRAWRQDNGL
jgi:hypothetical protein